MLICTFAITIIECEREINPIQAFLYLLINRLKMSTEINQAFYNKSLEYSKAIIQPVMVYNDELLKNKGISRVKQFAEMKSKYGLKLDRSYFWGLKHGKHSKVNSVYLGFFAAYWNKSLVDMILQR